MNDDVKDDSSYSSMLSILGKEFDLPQILLNWSEQHLFFVECVLLFDLTCLYTTILSHILCIHICLFLNERESYSTGTREFRPRKESVVGKISFIWGRVI